MKIIPGDYFATLDAMDKILSGTLPSLMPLMTRLFPICRSLTGEGVRQTLDLLGDLTPLTRHRAKSGTRCFDWEVPREWNIRDAFIRNSKGEKLIDFKKNNLHVISYSVSVNKKLTLAELKPHLHTLPDFPDAIPYRTSYYSESWGFCLTHDQYQTLKEDIYEVVIDSSLGPGHLDYADLVLPGLEAREVFFSTYVCHPSLANNELSGPVVLISLMHALQGLPRMRHSCRALFAPETIGAILYLSRHHQQLIQQMAAGYVLTCVGDDGPYTYLRSRRSDTVADRAAEHLLKHLPSPCKTIIRDFGPNVSLGIVGSDERQYCSPKINLPVGSLMRTRYAEFREYHTSRDDLNFVSEAGLQGSLTACLRIVECLEMNCFPVNTNPYCEPMLGKRDLYPKIGAGPVQDFSAKVFGILNFSDASHELIDIANRLNVALWTLKEPLRKLVEAGLIDLYSDREDAAKAWDLL